MRHEGQIQDHTWRTSAKSKWQVPHARHPLCTPALFLAVFYLDRSPTLNAGKNIVSQLVWASVCACL